MEELKILSLFLSGVMFCAAGAALYKEAYRPAWWFIFSALAFLFAWAM
jgi:hypothetical protein